MTSFYLKSLRFILFLRTVLATLPKPINSSFHIGMSALMVVLFFLPSLAFSQSFTVFQADASSFPLVRSKFYALGKDGRPLTNLREIDFQVNDGNRWREAESVINPVTSDFTPVSAVLTVDISGSMTMESRIMLAQEAAQEWVNTIALDVSDCALTSFDDNSFVNQDFTHSRTKLLAAVKALKPNGGTDYDKGFTDSLTGALTIAKRGQNKRVVVFLTDGLGGGTQDKIIAAARRDSVVVYCITLGLKMPSVLKNVADSTGGAWFENISQREDLIAIYRRILFQAQNIQPSTLIWRALPGCDLSRETTVRLSTSEITTTGTVKYFTPKESLVRLQSTPRTILFRDVAPGNSQGQRITLKATFQPVTILGIETNNPRFSITGLTFPLRLESDETVTFTIGFSGQDSVPQIGRVDVRTDMCAPVSLYARASYGNRNAALLQRMTVTQPAAGDILWSGADTTIMWAGLMPSDDVEIDYSLDMGQTWQSITRQTKGLQYKWRVPSVSPVRLLTSNSRPMLVRARQIWSPVEVSTEPAIMLDAHYGTLMTARFSKDGTKILTASADKTAKIFDAYTGAVLQSFEGHGNFVSSASFSPDEKRILTTGFDNTVRLWDAETGGLLNTAYGQGLKKFFFDQNKMYGAEKLQFIDTDNKRFLFGAFSPDGNDILTVTDNGMAIRWKGTLLRPIGIVSSFAGGWMYSVQYNHDGRFALTAGGDLSARIWTGSATVRHFIGHQDQVSFAAFSPDEKRIVTASFDNTARIWDISTEKQIMLLPHKGNVWSARYSPDGKRIVTASLDGHVRIWDANSGELQLMLPSATGGFHDADFSPDGMRIIGAGTDANGYVWDIGGGFMQEATSQTFRVIAPQATLREVKMGAVMVGMVKDSVCTVLANPDKSVVRIQDVRITGTNAEEFSLVAGLPPFDIAAGSKAALELRFAPKSRGQRTAILEVVTWTDTLRATLTGEANAKGFEVSEKVNFGQVLLRRTKDTTFVALRNTGTLPLQISRIQKAAPDIEQFSFVGLKRTLTGGNGALTLAAGDSLVLKATFSAKEVGIASGGVRFEIVGVQKPVVVGFVAEATAPALDIALNVEFLDNTGATILFGKNDTIRVRQMQTTLLRPLLNYVFFDENSARIPLRYSLLQRHQTANFDENNVQTASTAASLKIKQIRGIESYYSILNILGKRLAADAKLTARIIGCNSDIADERGNTRLSEERANTVKQYFVETWGIDEKRLRLQARNKPERASNSNDPDGAAENRRVEIILEPNEALSPIASDEIISMSSPETVHLVPAIVSDEALADWALDVIAAPLNSPNIIVKQRIITTLSGTSAPPRIIDYRFSSKDLDAIGEMIAKERGGNADSVLSAFIQFRLRVNSVAGQFSAIKTPPTLISLTQMREVSPMLSQNAQAPDTIRRSDSSVVSSSAVSSSGDEEISRFALTFFDFDKSTLNQQNQQILNIVKSRVNSSTEAVVVGYTDRVGDAAYNKRLSTERAKTVGDLLSGISPQHKVISGVGESVLLYDNDLPEGRFYCRMVEILLKNRQPSLRARAVE